MAIDFQSLGVFARKPSKVPARQVGDVLLRTTHPPAPVVPGTRSNPYAAVDCSGAISSKASVRGRRKAAITRRFFSRLQAIRRVTVVGTVTTPQSSAFIAAPRLLKIAAVPSRS